MSTPTPLTKDKDEKTTAKDEQQTTPVISEVYYSYSYQYQYYYQH